MHDKELESGYWNLCNWYSLTDPDVLCVHVQNHDTGLERFVNVSKSYAKDRWNI